MSQLPGGARPAWSERIGLLVFAACLFLPALGRRDLWNPNEPLYGRAVVEMAERGSWLVPTVNDVVFDEKPILYFWLARLAALIGGGIDEFTLRLPSALAACASVVILHALLRRWVGPARAVTAAILLATTFAVFWNARSVQMDLLLMTTSLGALAAALAALEFKARAGPAFSAAGLALGLGFLAKGPVALVLFALPLAVFLGPRRLLTLLVTPVAWLVPSVALLVVAPWVGSLMASSQASVLVESLLRQQFMRLGDAWDHREPFDYYLRYLWVDFAPWSLLLPLTLRLPERSAEERRADRFAWGWIVSVVLFFSLAESKRSAYLLPIAPAVAILVSGLIARLVEGRVESWRRRSVQLVVALLGIAALAAALGPGRRALVNWPQLVEVGLVVIVGVSLCGVILVATAVLTGRRPRLLVGVPLAALIALYLVTAIVILPRINPVKSARAFGEAVAEATGPTGTLRAYRLWKWRASYSFYARRSIPSLDSVDELRDYWERSERVHLLVERGMLDDARRVLGDRVPVAQSPIGKNHVYLFANH